jgi:RNA polymerase sigma-70 factor (ECF subfamily)
VGVARRGGEAGRAEPADSDGARRGRWPGVGDFDDLVHRYRRELHVYCYRMLGSFDEAEDHVQEVLLRAWRSRERFQGRSSPRTWLYRIATNACLRAIENRGRRPLPSGFGAPGEDAQASPAAATAEVLWLQPIPDALFATATTDTTDPATIVTQRESMRLALVAALQYLPARQRAVLILRDVLDWRAAEVAALLGTTTAAINSTLQRARAQLDRAAPTVDDVYEPTDPQHRSLLERYVAAFEKADVAALMELLQEDAVAEMPPTPTWYAGREQIGTFLAAHVLRRPHDFRLVPTAANGQFAVGAYRRGRDGIYHGLAIEVLTISGPQIARITSFQEPALLATFGLPPDLEPRASR